jgi:hypothetical protein
MTETKRVNSMTELGNEDFDIVTTFTISRGDWMEADRPHDDNEGGWQGFYFGEFGTDWSMFPGCYGKLVMETMNCDIAAATDGSGRAAIREGGELRLAYQYTTWHMIPVEGSDVDTDVPECKDLNNHMIPVEGSEVHSSTGIIPARWQMVHSGWFKLPETTGDACVWIEGKPDPGKKISLALATLHVARPKIPIEVVTNG